MKKKIIETRTIKITAPAEAWEIMDELGLDYRKNLTEYLRQIYFEIRRSMEEKNDKSKK